MKKAQARGKMLQDLVTVVKRYIQDVESEKKNAKPIIITRSVGLQVVDNNLKKVMAPPVKKGQMNGPRPPMTYVNKSPQQVAQRPLPPGTVYRQSASPAAVRSPVKMALPQKRAAMPAAGMQHPAAAKRPMTNNAVMPPGVTISPIARANLNT